MHLSLRHALVLVVGLVATSGAGRPHPGRESGSLQQRIYGSFVEGDWARAADLIERYLARTPNDAVMLYNGACAYARLGQRDKAATYLMRAVDAGLRDLDEIANEPDLEGIRDHPTFVALLQRVQWKASRDATAALAQWRAVYGEDRYRYEKDQERHLAYATALDPVSHSQMRRMLERQADHLHRTLLGAWPSPYVLIAVPTPHDSRRLFDADEIGGIYEHSKRQLIARDIGGSLRHEFFHALHYAHMEQLKQKHPLWVQEGLASLYEDYIFTDDEQVVFLSNERHNIVKALAAVGRLTPWRDLLALSEEQFMARASQLYPQTRSIFEFLADRGRLRSWYRALIEHFDVDPTGATAFETCFGMPLADVERSWRRWLLTRPKIDTSIDDGDAALGIESRPNASNDGVVIARILPRSAAAGSQLRAGDTIVSVDGTPTRSLAELQTLIAAKRIGDTARVRARRDGGYFTVVVRLRPLLPMMW